MFNKIFAAIKAALAAALKNGNELFTAVCDEQRTYIAHEIARAEALERILSMAQDACVNNRDIIDVATRQNIQHCKYARIDLNERVSSFEAIGFCFNDLIEEVVDDALVAEDEVVKDVARRVNVDTFDDSSIRACRIYGQDTLYKGKPWGYGHGSVSKEWLCKYTYDPEAKHHHRDDFVAYGGKVHRKMERTKSHGRKAGRAAKEALAVWNS